LVEGSEIIQHALAVIGKVETVQQFTVIITRVAHVKARGHVAAKVVLHSTEVGQVGRIDVPVVLVVVKLIAEVL